MEPESIEVATPKNHNRMPQKYKPQRGDARYAKSRMTNGGDWLPGVDQRSAIARRYRDLCALIVSDQGGVAHLSEAKVQLIRRFSALSVQCEALEARLAAGEQLDISEYTALTSTLVRVVTRLGIARVPKTVSPPTLSDILRADEQEDDAA